MHLNSFHSKMTQTKKKEEYQIEQYPYDAVRMLYTVLQMGRLHVWGKQSEVTLSNIGKKLMK